MPIATSIMKAAAKSQIASTANMDVLDIEQLAALLRCSVDHARRIPRRELPASRVGKKLLFLREDALAYIKRKRSGSPPPPANANGPATPSSSPPQSREPSRGETDLDSRLSRLLASQ